MLPCLAQAASWGAAVMCSMLRRLLVAARDQRIRSSPALVQWVVAAGQRQRSLLRRAEVSRRPSGDWAAPSRRCHILHMGRLQVVLQVRSVFAYAARQAMVPLWDSLNHITGRCNVRLHHDEDAEALQMIATAPIPKGAELVRRRPH